MPGRKTCKYGLRYEISVAVYSLLCYLGRDNVSVRQNVVVGSFRVVCR
jgi:hypothetical protein